MRRVTSKSAIARKISSSGQNACLAAGLRPDPLRELKRSPSLPKPQWVSWKGTLSSRGYWRFEARKGGRWKYVEGAEMNEKVYH